jgi:hypothetical protein
MKHLQYTSETIETYVCNMHFQRNISLLLGRMEARQHIEFTGGRRDVATIDQIDFAYREAGGDPFVATGILGSMQDT